MSLFTWFPSYSVGSSAFLRLVWRFHFSLRAIVEAWVICGTSRGTGNESDKDGTLHALAAPFGGNAMVPLWAIQLHLIRAWSYTSKICRCRVAVTQAAMEILCPCSCAWLQRTNPATFIHHHQVWLPVSQSEPSQQTLKDLHWILPFPAGS